MPIEKIGRKRIANLEEDENLERVELLMPKNMLDKLKQKAFEKDVSRASIIREALNKWFKEQENTQLNPEATISDEDLNEILDACTTFYGGFEIDGEDGFIALMETNDFKLKDLTPEQWERVKEKISIGYNGYFIKPDLEEFAEKFEVLEPSEEQYEWLSSETEEESEGETED